ncbi:MAG TPA: SpoIIE family protein phosphatase [Thermoanaerobaculia bacterium]|jgi:hypothetical protein|nr:SpoIIE family protein phosphatase [Thermoanaerobaculia bacterium]
MANSRARGATVLILLAPLAALLGAYFTARDSTAAKLRLAVSRDDAVRIAKAHAATYGVKTDDWRNLVDLRPNNNLRHYLETTATSEERAAIARMVAPVPFRTTLENPKQAVNSVRTWIGPDGRVMGWRVPPLATPPPISEADARNAAEAELRRTLGNDSVGFTYAGTGVERHEPTSSDIRRFTYRKQSSSDLAIEATIETSGTRVIGFRTTPQISAAYQKRFIELTSSFNTARGVPIVLLFIGGLVFVIARFVRRLREQEIPIKRAAIVATCVFFAFAFTTFLNSETQRIDLIEEGATLPVGIDFIMVVVVALTMATLLGLTWGACEADVREAYPEKLVSTDALLGGYGSSRALRRSLITGLTCAAYAILIVGLEGVVRSRMGGWMNIQPGELLPYQSAYPSLAVILFGITGLPILLGLLIASISVTHRRGVSRNAQIALAVLLLIVMILSTIGNHRPIAWSLSQAAISAAVLIGPFFIGDLLAVIVSLSVSSWAAVCATLIAQPAAGYRSAGWTMLAVLAVVIGGAAIATFRRREDTADVETARPEYARNMAARMMLRTEMDTARQAQMRVMPRVVPEVAGVLLATKHSESSEIGTDYAEFFPSTTHVSVAVADARLPGLSSALCVSMLKGLLMNYAARLTSPRDIADRVYRQLSAIFGDDLPLSFFFGRLDRATGEFLFASFGDMPHAVLVSSGNVTSLEGEELARLTSDTLIIYTAPLAQLRDRDGAPLSDEALHRELTTANPNPRHLLDTLSELAARHARGVETPQSWTAVAIGLEARS